MRTSVGVLPPRGGSFARKLTTNSNWERARARLVVNVQTGISSGSGLGKGVLNASSHSKAMPSMPINPSD